MAQAQVAQLAQNSSISRWNLGTRIGFRFCLLYFGLYCVLTQILNGMIPFPLEVPDPGSLPPMRQMVFWTASHLLHAKLPLVYTGSGSGDKTFDWATALFLLLVSAITTAIWSVLDRRRENYDTLHKWFRLFLRFAFAGQMISYGMVKAMPLQMPFPFLTRLLEPFGNFSLMGVLWASVGASEAYERFTGCAEMLGGILLIVPRTVTLGSLVCLLDVTFIFVLNLTYDVPVKLFSFHLILMALFLLAPEFRRLIDFFFRNRAVEPSAQPQLFATRRANSFALAAQIVFGVLLIGLNAYNARTSWATYGGGRPKSALYGIWNVDELSIDGRIRSPLLTDYDRFQRAVFDFPDRVSFQRMNGSFVGYGAAINSKDNSIALTKADDKNWKGAFTFRRAGADALALDGTMNNHPMHMQLKLVDHRKFTLISRGFHWIQEFPFNR